ncbi:hypothetical protein RF11_09969 [Thelohanellus kitauei]|uniref:Uncharacterized protein n=1 Tax=Thelohanellus kitauei TaxID=669202 RepID=A0A0C2MTU5_THEKT|nr:hypothetical protein RF11_09969 [Thelohanellus kitauei]
MYHDKRQAFYTVSLPRKTFSEGAFDIAGELDESIDITDIAILVVFIRRVDKDIKITEEFVDLIHMKESTNEDDVCRCWMQSLERLCVDRKKFVSVHPYSISKATHKL